MPGTSDPRAGLLVRSAFAVRRAGCLFAFLLLIVITLAGAGPARALEPIVIGPNQEQIEITLQGILYERRGDRLQIETAPGADGIAGRMSVRASVPGTDPNWMVFALQNPTDKRIERWLTAARYDILGSGVIFPDLDSKRIEKVTPSLGFVPERVVNDRADIFRITLDPGQTVTFIAELASDRFPRVYLWKALAYEHKQREGMLFNGIMIGITGLLAIFLTAIFAANHKAIFPATALVAWSVLAYLCVDFSFWHKLFQLTPENNALYRAASEAAVATSIVVFVYAFLRVGLWHRWIRLLFTLWIIGQLALVAGAVLDPRLASTFARISFPLIAALGTLLIVYLAVRGQDRALSLVPTWLLFIVWLFGATMAVLGYLNGEIVLFGLISGLVLIIVLLGFTVTQFAFRTIEPIYGAPQSELQLRSLAVDGAAAATWEWNARRDEIMVSPLIEEILGLGPGELSGRVADWTSHLHPTDRERFRLVLWSVQEKNGGSIHIDFRMRRTDSSYRWFDLEATSVPEIETRALRCVGLMRDVTNARRAQERMMHDAVHDSLTGLPNRELFLDRLSQAILWAKEGSRTNPTVLFIDIDRFKNINSVFGLIVGDTMLLTVARRLGRHLGAQDTLARVGGDRFAILLVREMAPREIAMLAERVRRSLRSPMKIAGKEIVLTGSIGIAIFDSSQENDEQLLREAEIAMYRAKRSGADRIEIFKAEWRSDRDDRVALESELRRAIERRQIGVLYQPITRLDGEEIAGFEALIRWDHPKLGRLNPVDFVPLAEDTGLIVELGGHVLDRAVREAAKWQKLLPRPEAPLFVSVNISSRQLFRQDLVQEIGLILGRETVPKGGLRLEVTESLVMENPERAAEILDWLKGAGASLSLDDFGAGYCSLAYLHRFPFDTIKVNRSLVQEGGIEGSGPVIVRSIVALAHELDKDVVAEGVETAEDVAFLRSIGCEYAQGFYYGEPMTDREVAELLKVLRKSDRRVERKRRSDASRERKRLADRRAGRQGGDEGKASKARSSPETPGQRTPAPEGAVPVSGRASGRRASGSSSARLAAAMVGAAAANGSTGAATRPGGRVAKRTRPAGHKARSRSDGEGETSPAGRPGARPDTAKD